MNRVIRNAYRKAGFPESFLARLDNFMAAVGEVWSRQGRSLYVTVSCMPSAFLYLGNRSFTNGDGSCYRDEGEWEGAKHALMLEPNSCVYYFYSGNDFDVDCDVNTLQTKNPVARAWGYWTPGELVAASNFYGLPQRELRTAMSMIAESELGRTSDATKVGANARSTFFGAMKYFQYLNSDSLLWANGPRQTRRIRLGAIKAVAGHMGPRDICNMRYHDGNHDAYDERGAELDYINLTDIDAEIASLPTV